MSICFVKVNSCVCISLVYERIQRHIFQSGITYIAWKKKADKFSVTLRVNDTTMKHIGAALIAFSSSVLLCTPSSYSYDIREPQPDTGYWNYLPILGLWGRVVHYAVTDTDGIGTSIKMLDSYFKDKYGDDKYVALERSVVEKLPKGKIFYHLMKIKENLENVRDPITGKTLGYAFDILKNLQDDPIAEQEYSTRLNLVQPDSLSFHSSMRDFDLKQVLKNTILENPIIITEVLEDPQVDSYLTSAILGLLSTDKLANGFQTLQNMLTNYEELISATLNENNLPLLAIKDEESDMSLSQILMALVHIIENPEFAFQLKTLISPELLAAVHENVQGSISKVIQHHKASHITPRNFAKKLKAFNIQITPEDAAFIIEASEEGDLDAKAGEFLAELNQVSDLDAKKISEIITSKGVTITPQMVTDAVDLLVNFPPEMISATLKNLGLSMSPSKVKDLQATVREMKAKYDAKRGVPPHKLLQDIIKNDEPSSKGTEEESGTSEASKTGVDNRSGKGAEFNTFSSSV